MKAKLRTDKPHNSTGGAPLCVLVVEDDADTAHSMAALLRLYQFDVHVAMAGPDALRAVHKVEPDVVLLDIGLPELDGWQVAKCIREQTTNSRPFLVAISGYGQQTDLLRSQEAGIDLHLLKPVEPAVLERVLREVKPVTNVKTTSA